MTVHDIEAVRQLVGQGWPVAVYRYEQADSGEVLYSVEDARSVGCTLSSPFVKDPVLLYWHGEWVSNNV
jgi:hypothetical protein